MWTLHMKELEKQSSNLFIEKFSVRMCMQEGVVIILVVIISPLLLCNILQVIVCQFTTNRAVLSWAICHLHRQ